MQAATLSKVNATTVIMTIDKAKQCTAAQLMEPGGHPDHQTTPLSNTNATSTYEYKSIVTEQQKMQYRVPEVSFCMQSCYIHCYYSDTPLTLLSNSYSVSDTRIVQLKQLDKEIFTLYHTLNASTQFQKF